MKNAFSQRRLRRLAIYVLRHLLSTRDVGKGNRIKAGNLAPLTGYSCGTAPDFHRSSPIATAASERGSHLDHYRIANSNSLSQNEIRNQWSANRVDEIMRIRLWARELYQRRRRTAHADDTHYSPGYGSHPLRFAYVCVPADRIQSDSCLNRR